MRRRPGVGGEVCLRIHPPPAATTTLDIPLTFPVRLAFSRRSMLPTLASDARITTSWGMCTSSVQGGSTQTSQGHPPGPHLHARRVHPQGLVDSRHGNTLTVKLILPPRPFKGMPRLPMCLTSPPPPTLMRPHTTTMTNMSTTVTTTVYDEQPAPEDYGYVDHQHMPSPPPQYKQPPEYYNYAQHQQPPPPPQTQKPYSIDAPFPSSSPAPGASSSPPSQLHLLMARSVPQREAELNPALGRVGFCWVGAC